jgi:4-hydroxythreonine-4-phosphate dehydrogenase
MSTKPVIAITMGDPAGVGPEICLKALQNPAVRACCRPRVIGARAALAKAAETFGLAMPRQRLIEAGELSGPLRTNGDYGENGTAAYACIMRAIKGVKSGEFDAVTTAPISKAALQLGGIYEPGHTEIFAQATGTRNFAMMLYSPRLTVSLVTCHKALEEAFAGITARRVVTTAELTGEALRRIRGQEPRLAVLGFNPHAGESGIFGREEIESIAPAVKTLRQRGWQVEGPLSPDSAFMPHRLKQFDAHICMYHDQGLIPFKMVSLHDGINVTLGLPVVRTSVDHGTAYDIAWKGRADSHSLVCAIRLAAKLTEQAK